MGLSLVGSLLLWLRYRQPASHMSSITEFQREMSALRAQRPPTVRATSPVLPPGGPVQGSTVQLRPPTIDTPGGAPGPQRTSGSSGHAPPHGRDNDPFRAGRA